MERRSTGIFRAINRSLSRNLLAAGAFGLSVIAPAAGDEPAVEFVTGSLSDTPKLKSPLPATTAQTIEAKTVLPIDLPTVLELARASNTEIQIAAEKIREANSLLSLARMQWVPSLQIGATYLHHDGRIQDIDGTIFDASKSSMFGGGLISLQLQPMKVAVDVLKARQLVSARSGELDRVTRSTLQEVSLAYVDLVAAQVGASISLEVTGLIEDLRDRAEKLEKEGVGTKVDLQRNRALLISQLQRLSLAKQNQLAASARLAQLLGLPPGTRLVTAEESLAPLNLVDENQPEETFHEAARNQGPGLSEVVALLEGLDQQERQIRRIALLPNVNVDVGGGSFGGGFGGQLNSFNGSSDYSLRMYWDVTKIIGTSTTRELFASKRRQASMQHEQIIGKLLLGVTVARETAVKAHERIRNAETEIEMGVSIYETSRKRLLAGEPPAAFEVQQAIGTLAQARGNYVAAVIDFNRAQIQLQYLIGVGSAPCSFDFKEKHRLGKRAGRMAPWVKPAPRGPLGPPTTLPVNGAAPVSPGSSRPVGPGPAIPSNSTGPARSANAAPAPAQKIPFAKSSQPSVPLRNPENLSRVSAPETAKKAPSKPSATVSAAVAKSEPVEVIADSDSRHPSRIRQK